MPSDEAPDTADRDATSHDPDEIHGTILVAYHIEEGDLDDVRTRLREFFRRESGTADDPMERPFVWGPETEWWVEAEPSRRINHFEAAVDGWSNEGQKPRLEAAVNHLRAEIQEGDVLPFDYLVFEFGLSLSEGANSPNAPDLLVSITQQCQDLTSWMLGGSRLGDGQIIATTTRRSSKEELESLRETLARLKDAKEEDYGKLLESHPLIMKPPIGVRSEGVGFSHYSIATNLHAVIGHLGSSLIRGPGWAITVYEDPMGTDSNTWGASGLGLIDPLRRRRETAYVEKRITGLPMALVLWNWIAKKNHAVRRFYDRLADMDHLLGFPLLWPPTLFAVRPIHELTSDTRSLVHKLQTIRDEYGYSLEAFRSELERTRSQETWIPRASQRRLASKERPQEGLLYRMVDHLLRNLDLLSTAASNAWEMAKSQQEDYSTRIQRAVAVAVLFLGLVEAAPFLVDWFGPLFGS